MNQMRPYKIFFAMASKVGLCIIPSMYDKYHSLVTSSYNIPTNVQLCFWFSIGLAMNSLPAQHLRPHSISSMQDDVLIRELFLSHDPDGRRLDSEQVLRAMENIMCYATASEVPVSLCSHLQCYLFFFLLKFKDVHSLRLQELKRLWILCLS